jgi:hypothetical protein
MKRGPLEVGVAAEGGSGIGGNWEISEELEA